MSTSATATSTPSTSRRAKSNSLTRGVLDQRLVDFLTRIVHPETHWFARGLGSSVNKTNAAGRKYGDEEYLDLDSRKAIKAYEAHGGSLRDEYAKRMSTLFTTPSATAREKQSNAVRPMR